MDDPRFGQLADLIAGSPHNLVSRGERGALLDGHIPEALALLPHLPLEQGGRWLDLGTGGGLPGLALAIATPQVEWVLLDSTRKKVTAVTQFAAALGLANVTTVVARAEDAAHDPALRGAHDGVVARAVAPLPTLVELARGFVRAGGMLGAVKGPAWSVELSSAARALEELRWVGAGAVHITSAERPTWLVRMRAEGPPPRGYPRRTGVPRQDPIGGP